MENSLRNLLFGSYGAGRVLCFAMFVCCSFLLACEDSDFSLDSPSSSPNDADILYVIVDRKDILKVESDSLFRVYGNDIEIGVRHDADLTAVAPRFVLTRGAGIYLKGEDGRWSVEADGVARDFSRGGQQYMVVSANGRNHHLYTLTFNAKEVTTMYGFESFALNDSTRDGSGGWRRDVPHFYVWKEYDERGDYLFTWATANGGYGMAKMLTAPDDYPTSPCEGVDGGRGVKLTTMKTGSLAEMLNIRLAAGNLFLGEFDISSALRSPMESTRFGIPFDKKPLVLRGWMSYAPGKNYQNEHGEYVEWTDSCDIYAVLYKNKGAGGEHIVLDGNTIAYSPSIVCKAQIDPSLAGGTDGEWRYFESEFVYEGYSEPLVVSMLQDFTYSMAIVASSSRNGGSYCGAVGSVLRIDNLELVCEK